MLKRLWITGILLGLLLLSGCQIPGTALPDDGPRVAVSEDAAVSLEQKAAEAAAIQGVTTISLTQEEVTSYLALRLTDLAVQQGIENSLRDPQVYLKGDGTLILRGAILFQERRQPIRVVARPEALDGLLRVDITEGRIGPVPVPGPILDQLESQLAQAILAGQEYARLDSITVAEGSVTLVGERR